MKHPIHGLFYCQYLVGVGHLIRSLNICRSLIKKFEIDFLLGGKEANLTLNSPHFHLLKLTPHTLLEVPNETPEGLENSKKRMSSRLNEMRALSNPYDFFVTEFFPFSKWQFKEEIEVLLHQLKKLNSNCLVACSLRDSFPRNSEESTIETLNFIEKFYDIIFVHSDPRIYKLEESFDLADKLRRKVFYTGFIVRELSVDYCKKRKKRIVVSLGAGSFGEDLIYAVLEIVAYFPDYQFVIVKGPMTSSSLIKHLEKLIKLTKNGMIIPFIDHFPEYLSESALSISLGGYTIIDVAYTKTPAIVYPSTFYDQYVRALKFAAFGFLKIVTQEDLKPKHLKEIIKQSLKMDPSPFDIDVFGAETTSAEIARLIKSPYAK